ncbi:hypothetical protein A2617_03160 [Candidatus Daviesbacteria bacterium RIFOXYD1_FULL_41_10]|uniref:RadC-like JAB domain-containing protein n=2 Tax=Candidatus Daviesiibacteriota TaxID=1752718 RepID=A0A1F5N008_9BACT|nr:MAG: hypothetical protein UU67_C0047G0006 [Candidatus Daviesbacteria bacterium GW2011_GWB1_41_5]OGE70913.1 MAG: hypothetical protein A2617_03160 [Candidatus Daviesbacteria bacterium RIFOXYD1_FULL_41_10]
MDNLEKSKETITGQETGLSLEELNRIAVEINNTSPNSYGDIAHAEFGWLYFPGRPLQPLKSRTDNIIAVAFMSVGSAFFPEAFSGTDAIAVVHNHPNGHISPSIEDVNWLLDSVAENGKLKYELIAATNLEKVTGFYELQFLGERSKTRDLIQKNKDLSADRIRKKREWLDQHPEIKRKMLPGQYFLSPAEHNQLAKDAIAGSLIVGRARPLSGFRLEKDHFVTILP